MRRTSWRGGSSGRPSVGLFGYFGGNNLGDDLMLHAALELWSDEADLTVFARDVEAVDTEGHDHVVARPATAASMLRVLPRLDVLVRCGGTIFHDETGSGAGAMARLYVKQVLLLAAARLAGVRVVLVGIGLGQVRRRSTQLCRDLALRLAHHVVLRDRVSLEIARAVVGPRAELGIDLFYTSPVQRRAGPAPSPTLVLSVVDLDRYRTLREGSDQVELWCRIVRVVLERADIREVEIAVLKDNERESDRPLSEKILAQLESEGISCSLLDREPSAVAEAISSAAVVIATRYHAAVLAAMAGRPAILVPYNEKLRSHARDFGMAESLISPDLSGPIPTATETEPLNLDDRVGTTRDALATFGVSASWRRDGRS